MKPTFGLIGFFDILGYQNLLENNSPESIADTVLNKINNLPETVKKNTRHISSFKRRIVRRHNK